LVWANRQFESATLKAKTEIKNGDLLSGIVWAQIAATIAWARHPGFYVSMELESLLLDIASKLDTKTSALPYRLNIRFKKSGDKTHILHVITHAYETGGHTRAVERWIRNTVHRDVHSLVTTNHQGVLPGWLTSAVMASGGQYCSLADFSTNLLHRALLLRQVGREWADVIVLHVHPYDSLPMIAFGTDGGPPIILFNHADHVFWLGASIADLVADITLLGQHLSVTKRGIRNSKILPIPLLEPCLEPNRDTARRRLGIRNDMTVLLSIAEEARYLRFASYDFLGTIATILQRNHRSMLIAVGPRHTGQWVKSSALASNRIRATGPRTDLGLFYACADIYLPSFPLGGLTALLDAGLRGIPVLGLYFREAPKLCGADDPSLEGLLTHASTIEEYVTLIERMIDEPALRYQKGEILKERIRRIHVPPGWNIFLEGVLQSLPSEHKVGLPSTSPRIDISDIFQAGVDPIIFPRQTLNNFLVAHTWNLPLVNRISSSIDAVRISGDWRLASKEHLLNAGLIVHGLLRHNPRLANRAHFPAVLRRILS